MLDKTTYLAYYEEESLRFWQPPPIENFISNNPYIIPPPQRILSSGIPTLGAPATVIDQYRMHAKKTTEISREKEQVQKTKFIHRFVCYAT